MFVFAYLMVPLYTLLCKQEGINGKVFGPSAAAVGGEMIDRSRSVTVEFSTLIHGNLAFEFAPLTRRIDMHPGENKQVYFYAENKTGHALVIQAIPSIAPGQSAKYIKKTQCFCFTQQAFESGEKAQMPVLFHIDPDLPKTIDFINLNYTLYDASEYPKAGPHRNPGRIDL